MSKTWWKSLLQPPAVPATADAFTAVRQAHVASTASPQQVARPKLKPLPQRPCQCGGKR